LPGAKGQVRLGQPQGNSLSESGTGQPQVRKAATFFIFITIVLDALAIGIVIPVMPQLIASVGHIKLDNAATYVGLFGSSWALMQLLASPVQGALSDCYGRRPVILVSNCGMGMNYMLMALAPNLGVLWIGRLISGACAGSIPAAMAYLADVNPPEKRAASFGLIGAGFSVGFMIGPALGGFLGALGPRAPFWAAASLSLVNFLYGTFVLPESLARERRAPIELWRLNPIGALYGVMRSYPALAGMLVVSLLLSFAQLGPNNIFVLYAAHWYGWNSPRIGLFMTVGAMAGLVVQAFLVAKATQHLGERRSLILGAALTVAGLTLYGMAPTGVAFWFGVPFAALGAIGGPAWSALMSRQVGPTEQGRLAGATSSLQSLAQIIAPMLFTGVFQVTIANGGASRAAPLPQGAPFYMAAVVMAAAAVLAIWTTRRRPAAALARA
jgi:DHA1 family tetracycline resistance protein-like MFS transporter